MSALAVVPARQNLYTIEENLQSLIDTAELVAPEQEAAFVADLGAALLAARDKRDGMAHWMAHCESQITLAAEEIIRLRDRKNSYEAALDRIKSYLVRVIEANDGKKLEGSTVTFSIRKCPVSIDVFDAAAVPADYKTATITVPGSMVDEILDALPFGAQPKIEYCVEKKAIKGAMDGGALVEGARFAEARNSLVRK